VWSAIYTASGLSHSRSVSNIFGSWLRGIEKELKPVVLLGAAAALIPMVVQK
jgi:hypothetical protein